MVMTASRVVELGVRTPASCAAAVQPASSRLRTILAVVPLLMNSAASFEALISRAVDSNWLMVVLTWCLSGTSYGLANASGICKSKLKVLELACASCNSEVDHYAMERK